MPAQVSGSGETRQPAALPALLADAGLPFALVGHDGVVVAVNPTFAEMLARAPEDLAGRRLGELVAGGALEQREVAEVVAGSRRRFSFETRLRRGEDDEFWGDVTLTPGGEVDGRAVALVLLDDTSDRRRRDEEQEVLRDLLGAAASEWRATFDAIDMPIFILGAGRSIERLNRAASDLAGRDFQELLGRRLAEMGDAALWSEADRLVEAVGDELRPRSLEVDDAETGRSWLLSANPGLPDLSAARPVILVVREMTGIVQLQESLRRSQTMAVLGTLVAGVAHEVRNPLFGISAVVDALERRIEARHELAGHLAFLRRDVGRLEKLMADLLQYGRPVVPEPEPVHLDRVVDEALLACGQQIADSSVTVDHRVAETPQPVLLDRRRVVQALVNLVENAIHHAPPESRLEISVERTERGGRGWSQVTVRDHGPGFRDADLPRLFEPFFSRREGGTGLGLPIVMRIVEGHGGEVEARNVADGGALVRLRFPIREDVGNGGDAEGMR